MVDGTFCTKITPSVGSGPVAPFTGHDELFVTFVNGDFTVIVPFELSLMRVGPV